MGRDQDGMGREGEGRGGSGGGREQCTEALYEQRRMEGEGRG